VVTETTITTTTTTTIEEKYRVVAPESMQETFMSDSEDEGGKTALIRINCMVSDLVKDECIHLLTCGFSSLYVTQCYRSQVLRVILLTNSDTRVKWLCVFIL